MNQQFRFGVEMIVLPKLYLLRAMTFAVLLPAIPVGMFQAARAQIPTPTDAPKPLPPEESVKQFKVPDGFRLELIAAEPLVREPSGMCWDASGRLFVCELHGYNMDGQLDIEELNKTGKLDHEVRRVRASDEIKAAAQKFMYGTVKLLSDTDGDRCIDHAEVFADHLPPCYGICPARDGIVAVGAPDILFLADRDGDGRAEVREMLFTGFEAGPLERGINCPQWGLDDWIYIGRGHGSATITGPHLAEAVKLPRTDFRIKADGSAIEPILGGTNTIGFAFTERGERFVIWTYSPGIYVAPIPWSYLARNPDFAPGRLEERLGDIRTYPTSRPHPWRTRRAEDPGFSEFYNKRNGIKETAPNGYFTSACSPLVYQSNVLPGLQGQLLVCEPAQNMIHRAVITREGPMLRLSRAPGEEQSEFLTSTDQWFNPIALAHAPDGSIAIADFYREIIEDYSAIPRYLQQQYELKNGNEHGRIWQLTHQTSPAAVSANMSRLSANQLVEELSSSNLWRRQTAKRLLVERNHSDVAAKITELVQPNSQSATVINALYTLEALGRLDPPTVLTALASDDAGVRIHALRLSEPWLDRDSKISDRVFAMIGDPDDAVALQLALTLGESRNSEALAKLAELARQRGDIRWMDVALMSSLQGRAGAMLELLLSDVKNLGHARRLLAPLSAAVASNESGSKISRLLEHLLNANDGTVLATCLQGMKSRSTTANHVALSETAAESMRQLAAGDDRKIAALAQGLIRKFGVESAEERTRRIDTALCALADIQLPLEERLAAIAEIENEDTPQVTRGLLAAVANSTPTVQSALLEAVFSRHDRLKEVIVALEAGKLPASLLTAIQRSALLSHPDSDLRSRAKRVLESAIDDKSERFALYNEAFKNARNATRGGDLFRKHCATCHQAHGIGVEVGPNLTAETKRAEETLLHDILSPSATITAGYTTYSVTTLGGEVFTGVLTSESATGITLKRQEGKTHTILRKDIDVLKSSPVSLMPDDLTKVLEPQDVADIAAWLKNIDAASK